jgi:hypothetical protein
MKLLYGRKGKGREERKPIGESRGLRPRGGVRGEKTAGERKGKRRSQVEEK